MKPPPTVSTDATEFVKLRGAIDTAAAALNKLTGDASGADSPFAYAYLLAGVLRDKLAQQRVPVKLMDGGPEIRLSFTYGLVYVRPTFYGGSFGFIATDAAKSPLAIERGLDAIGLFRALHAFVVDRAAGNPATKTRVAKRKAARPKKAGRKTVKKATPRPAPGKRAVAARGKSRPVGWSAKTVRGKSKKR